MNGGPKCVILSCSLKATDCIEKQEKRLLYVEVAIFQVFIDLIRRCSITELKKE